MKNIFTLFTILSLSLNFLNAQCYNAFNEGGTQTPLVNSTGSLGVGSGTYAIMNVLEGGIYSFGHCGTVPANWGSSSGFTSDSRMNVSNTANSVSYTSNDDNGPVCVGNDASTSWTATFDGQIRVHSNGYLCEGWKGAGGANSATLTYRCDPPTTPVAGTAGSGTWNVYCYNAGDATGGSGAWTTNYSGYYTDANVNFNTATNWATSPIQAASYRGCFIGNDNHSWRAIRTGWTCDVYQIDVNGHDDRAQLYINGTLEWNHTGCCDAHANVWTGVLSSTDIVEFRASEGGGGSNGRITITDVSTALVAGTINYSGNTVDCDGYNPPALGSTSAASGGASAAITNGSSDYQWQLNGTDIGGATALTYNPGALTPGTYTYRREVTDKCAATANSNSFTITISAQPTASAGGSQAICVGSTATVSGASSTNGTISWSEDGAGTITAGGTTLTPTYTSAAGDAGNAVTLTMTVSNAPCVAATATYTVNVSAQPTASAGGSQAICVGSTATVSGASSTNGTISWSEDGAGTITAGGTTLTPTYTSAAGDAGNAVTLTMTVSNAPCVAATATYTVNVSAQPTASAGGSQAICVGSTATVSGASSTNGTISWSEDGAGTITAGGATLTPTYTSAAGDAGNAVTLTMTVSNAPCVAATATYTVNVSAQPTASAGGSQAICVGSTATVSGASSTNGTISWSEDGAGTITAGGATLTPTYTSAAGDAGNAVTLTMTVSNAPCVAATATYTVNVSAQPTASAGGSQAICVGSTATVSGASSTNGTISWSEDGAGTITAGGATLTPTYTSAAGDAGNAVTLTMTVSNAPCVAATATYTVNVSAQPTASAGGSQAICVGSTATVSGASSTNGTISWSEDGAGTITAGGATLTPTYTSAAGDAGNAVTLTMTVSNAPCVAATATYTVNVSAQPTASAGGSQAICVGSTATVSGASSTNGTISWSEDGAGTITAGGTTLTPTYTSAAGDAGNAVTLTMTVTGSAPCVAATATYTVNVSAQPTAVAGGSETICVGSTATVSGASSTNGTISWSEDGAGTITAGGTTLTPTYTSAAGDAGNAVTLTMTVSNAPCVAATATYTVNVSAQPTASAGGSQAICVGSTATVSGASSTNGTISWSEDGAGTITAGGTTLTPTYTSAAGDAGNTVTLTMTVTGSAPCVAATATYTVNVSAQPTASAGGSQAICVGSTATVSGASSTNGTISWSEDGAGTITAGGATLTPTYTSAAGDAGNAVTLTMTVSNAPCVAATATYTVNVSAQPTASAGGSETICVGSTAAVSGASSTNGTISWSEDGAGTITAGGTTLTPTYTSAAGDAGNAVTLTMTVSNAPCVAATATYTVTIDATPTTATAGADMMACLANSALMTANIPAVGTGAWTWAGPGTVTYTGGTNASMNNAQVSFDTNGAYTGTWTISNGTCTPSTDDVIVTVNTPNPLAFADVTGTCTSIGQNDWLHIYDPTGLNVIASINDNGQTLGDITASLYYHGGNAFSVPANNGQCAGNWQAVLNRSFVINAVNPPGSNVGVRLYFTDAELANLVALAGCNDPNGCDDDDDVCGIGGLYVTQISGATEDGVFVNGDGTATLHDPIDNGTGNATFGGNYVEFSVGSFSEFWIHGSESGVPLPVELTSFTAKAIDNDYIQLAWSTATEINNDRFELERSTNGIDFEQIAEIAGNGNTTEEQNYIYKDTEVSKGITYYYQLRQVDYNGESETFAIVNASLTSKDVIEIGNVTPNPSKENTSIYVDVNIQEEEVIRVTVYNHIGMLVGSFDKQLSVGTNKVDYNINELASGTYFINFEGSFGKETKKFVIAK